MRNALKSVSPVSDSSQEISASERRQRSRKAPGFRSRKGEKLVDGMTKAELVRKYESKVRFIAAKMIHNLPNSVEVDDLVSVGFIGLMDAADKFSASRGVKFGTYAEFRIRGAILDELRNQDWVPHCARGRAKAVDRAVHKIERETGRRASDAEVSAELGVSEERLNKIRKTTGSLTLVSIEASEIHHEAVQQISDSSDATNPYIQAVRNDARSFLEGMFATLPQEEKMVLSLYYFRGLNLKEIAQIMDLSESRISQLHTRAIFALKKQLKEQSDCPESLFSMLLEAA